MAVLITDGRSATVSTGVGYFPAPRPYVPPSAGSLDYVWVEVLDRNLVSQGMIQFVSITAQLYYNAVGSWSILVPYSDWLWNMMMSGEFFINVNWRGLFSFGGKCEKPAYQDSIPGASSGTQSGPYISLSGADYLALIANRVVYPNPGVAWSAQNPAASDAVTSVPLETAIKHYVNNNIGPLALAARQNSKLIVATDQARGPNVSYNVKFGATADINLFSVIRALIAAGNSKMGVSMTRNVSAQTVTFDVYIPRDLSSTAWFSERLGNLTSVGFSLADPTITDSLIYGQAQFLQTTGNGKTQWNVVEKFNDMSSESSAANLTAQAQTDMQSGAISPTLTVVVADTPFLTFGRDYGIGDIVTVEVRPGNFYTDVVSSVTLTADPAQNPQITAVPTIGSSADATSTDQTELGQLRARVRALERKLSMK